MHEDIPTCKSSLKAVVTKTGGVGFPICHLPKTFKVLTLLSSIPQTQQTKRPLQTHHTKREEKQK